MKSNLRFHSVDTSNIVVPYLEERFGLNLILKNIHLEIKNIDFKAMKYILMELLLLIKFTIKTIPKLLQRCLLKKAKFDYKFF